MEATPARHVFLTGATGYLGSRLAARLLVRGHAVTALVRPGSAARLPAGATPVLGDALDSSTYAGQVAPADTFVHLVGVAHPSPGKAELFRAVDLRSIEEAVPAAVKGGVSHFVYVSVARPAPVMKEYAAVRARGEELIQASGLPATILRPWYVLGPGHWWPLLLLPGYWLGELLPATRAGARRLGLVRLGQMLEALVHAVERRPPGVIDVPAIRRGGRR